MSDIVKMSCPHCQMKNGLVFNYEAGVNERGDVMSHRHVWGKSECWFCNSICKLDAYVQLTMPIVQERPLLSEEVKKLYEDILDDI